MPMTSSCQTPEMVFLGVLTAAGGSVAIGVRLENWSGYTLTQVESRIYYTPKDLK